MIRSEQPGAMVCIASIDGLTSAVSHAAYGAAASPRRGSRTARKSRERTARGPFKRRGTTDEIGKAALFLAWDKASYITGVTLSLDGGWAAASISGGIDVNSIPE